jgi:hypothetical protein
MGEGVETVEEFMSEEAREVIRSPDRVGMGNRLLLLDFLLEVRRKFEGGGS